MDGLTFAVLWAAIGGSPVVAAPNSLPLLDGSVYDYSAKCYFETLYVQGSRYLAEYRREVGSSAFWRGLQAFYEAYRFKISGTRTLFDYLDEASGFDSQRHADRFPTLYP